MRTYIIKRLLLSIPLVLAMSFIVFVFIKLSPGDYFAQFEKDRKQDRRIIERQKRELGYYKPVPIQYLYWLRGIFFDIKLTHERKYIADFEEREIEESYKPQMTADVTYPIRKDKGYYAQIKFSGKSDEFYRINQFSNPNPVEKGFWNLWSEDDFSAVELDIENLGKEPLPITTSIFSKDIRTGEEKEVLFEKTVNVRKSSRLCYIGKYLTLLGGIVAFGIMIAILLHSGFMLRTFVKGLLVTAALSAAYVLLIIISDYDHSYSIQFAELKSKGVNLTNISGVKISCKEEGTLLLDNFRLVEKKMPQIIGKPNFGYSFSTREPVFKMLMPQMLNTIKLSFFSIIFTWLIAIPIGIYCAVKQYSIADNIFAFLSFIGMSIPNFFFALLLLYLVSLAFQIPEGSHFYFLNGLFPIKGLTSTNYSSLSNIGKFFDQVRHLILPVFLTTVGGLAGLQRQMRGNLLEELRQLYITTARAKGLPENKIIYKHALRNAINPMVTSLGYFLAALISSSALVEIVFAYPGVGTLMLEAVRMKELYVVMGDIMLFGVLLVLGNLIADILLSIVDPRIRYD
jgi:peptide/nickel transport system permease protein